MRRGGSSSLAAFCWVLWGLVPGRQRQSQRSWSCQGTTNLGLQFRPSHSKSDALTVQSEAKVKRTNKWTPFQQRCVLRSRGSTDTFLDRPQSLTSGHVCHWWLLTDGLENHFRNACVFLSFGKNSNLSINFFPFFSLFLFYRFARPAVFWSVDSISQRDEIC